jgi:hypothetical protein
VSWFAGLLAVLAVLTRVHILASEAWQRNSLDQSILLASFEDLLSPGSGRPDLVAIGTGPGYLTLARALHLAGGTSIETLSLLSLVSSVVAVVLVMSSAFGVAARRLAADPLAAITVSLLTLFVPLAYLSRAPWTHLPATAIALGVVAAIRWTGSSRAAAWATVGILSALLFQTRNFEALVLGLAAVVTYAVTAALGWRAGHRPSIPLRVVAWAVVGFGLGWAAMGMATGTWLPYEQYSIQWTASDRALSIESLLVAGPQVLIDPCYLSICADITLARPADPWLTSSTALAQPLARNTPALIAATSAAWLLAIWAVRRRDRVPADIWIALLASAMLVIGYLSNPIMGGAHLKYGVARDFLLPSLLAVWALGRLLYRGRESASRFRIIVGLGAPLVAVALALVPLPRLDPVDLADYRLGTTVCDDWPCDVEIVLVQSDGTEAAYDGLVIATPFCNGVRGPRWEENVGIAACDGELKIGLLPRDLGFWQTPEGDRLLREKQVLIVREDDSEGTSR